MKDIAVNAITMRNTSVYSSLLFFLVILGWFVDDNVIDKAMTGKLIEENEVEVNPENVPATCLDENVGLPSVQFRFTEDAWMAVINLVSTIRSNPTWFCPRCLQKAETDVIVCESCLQWYHLNCVRLNSYKGRRWYCRTCTAAARSWCFFPV